MSWSNWYECKFDENGDIDTYYVENKSPHYPGIYAIATKTGWSYNCIYIGMSRRSIWKRLQAHFSGKGNRIIQQILESKKDSRSVGFQNLDALYFMFLEAPSRDVQWLEALYVRGTQPICNIQENLSLPKELQNASVPLEPED
jgi:hypothetical protein